MYCTVHHILRATTATTGSTIHGMSSPSLPPHPPHYLLTCALEDTKSFARPIQQLTAPSLCPVATKQGQTIDFLIAWVVISCGVAYNQEPQAL